VSCDGTKFVTGGEDKIVHLYDYETHEEVRAWGLVNETVGVSSFAVK
jgi:hypothetical protein